MCILLSVHSVIHWTVRVLDQDSATLYYLDLKSGMEAHKRPLTGITGALASSIQLSCLLVVKSDGRLVSLDEDSLNTDNQYCGNGVLNISVMLKTGEQMTDLLSK